MSVPQSIDVGVSIVVLEGVRTDRRINFEGKKQDNSAGSKTATSIGADVSSSSRPPVRINKNSSWLWLFLPGLVRPRVQNEDEFDSIGKSNAGTLDYGPRKRK
jgi:hypothetical protein